MWSTFEPISFCVVQHGTFFWTAVRGAVYPGAFSHFGGLWRGRAVLFPNSDSIFLAIEGLRKRGPCPVSRFSKRLSCWKKMRRGFRRSPHENDVTRSCFECLVSLWGKLHPNNISILRLNELRAESALISRRNKGFKRVGAKGAKFSSSGSSRKLVEEVWITSS